MLSSVHVASLLVCGSYNNRDVWASLWGLKGSGIPSGAVLVCVPRGVGMFAWDDVQRCNNHTEGL